MIARPTDFSDYQTYSKLLTIWHNQQMQDAENVAAHDNYVTLSQAWLVSAASQSAHSQPIDPKPIVPQKKIYNDDGTVTLMPFSDLKEVFLPTPNAPSSGSGASSNPPLDRTDMILIALSKLQTSIDNIYKIIGPR